MRKSCLILALAALGHAVDVPFNAGVGPTFHRLPGTLEAAGPYFGFSTDLYAAINGNWLRKNLHLVPEIARNSIWGVQEIHHRGLIGLLPSQFIVQPKPNGKGVYGASLGLFSFGYSLGRFALAPSVAFKLPTVSYMFINTEQLRRSKHFWGFGTSGSAELKFVPSPRMNMALRWESHFYAPTETTMLLKIDGGKESLWRSDALSLIVSYRFAVEREFRESN